MGWQQLFPHCLIDEVHPMNGKVQLKPDIGKSLEGLPKGSAEAILE